MAKRTGVKIAIGWYLLGCLLIYSGVMHAATDFWSTRQWKLTPEPQFFAQLFSAAVFIVRPFLAVVLTFWPVAIVPMMLLGAWCWGVDAVKFVKRNRND